MSAGKSRLENFERAMLNGFGSIRMMCACGKTYYYSDSSWGFDTGELEALRENADAVGLEYSPSQLSFEGQEYVDACTCWHPRAERIIRFIEAHAIGIVAFLKLEKERKLAEANSSPLFDEPTCPSAPGAGPGDGG